MIGIRSIENYLPPDCLDNIAQGASFGESEDFIRNRIGALVLPRKSPDEETSDLATKALNRLMDKTDLSPEEIEVLAVVTQNGDGYGLPHTSAIVQEKVGLPKTVAAFDISLGCSGYVYGLSVVKGFMMSSGMRSGVLVTADPYSKVIHPQDRGTTLLFGDAACATWIGENSEWHIGRGLFETDGSGAEHLCVQNGWVRMNGRQIFNFAVQNVPRHINRIVAMNELAPEDIDLFILHQGSAAIVEAIARKFPQVKDRFIIDISKTGNTVSSSIPLLLKDHLYYDGINRILVCGFGVGLSLATMILERKRA